MNVQSSELNKASTLVWTVLLCLIAGWGGYKTRERLVAGALVLPADALPSMEDLSPPESFSRIENTKRTLEALCLRLRLEIQSKIVANERAGIRQERSVPNDEPYMEGAI